MFDVELLESHLDDCDPPAPLDFVAAFAELGGIFEFALRFLAANVVGPRAELLPRLAAPGAARHLEARVAEVSVGSGRAWVSRACLLSCDQHVRCVCACAFGADRAWLPAWILRRARLP